MYIVYIYQFARMNDEYNIAFIKIYEHIQLCPTLIYIAVGSATNVLYNDDGLLKLLPEHDQQYPIFLQEFKKSHLDIPVVIILIDNRLHIDPFIVKSRYIKNTLCPDKDATDICFNDNSAPLDEGWELKSEIGKMKIYENKYTNIIVFAIKDNVDYKYCDDVCENNTDITDFNSNIATAVIDSGGCFVFNDFSGRDFSKYVEYMNQSYSHYLDRAVFGLGFGDYSGCFPELDKPCFIVQFACVDNKIRIFNPYCYIMDQELYKEELPAEFCVNIIRHQLGTCIHHIANNMYSTLFPVYRNIVLINTSSDTYNNHIQKYFNRAKYIYGDFDFTIDSAMYMIRTQLIKILQYVMSESRCDEIMILLNNDDMYTAIQTIQKKMYIIIEDFVKSRWV